MDVNNLTSVYNQNPTLQGQYTLPQYLALFGQGATPTPTPTPTPTATPAPSQGIVNQNINQYQSGDQGGADDKYTGFGDFGNLDESTAKIEYRDVSDGKGGSTIEKFTTYKDPSGLRRTIDGKFVTHGGHDIEPIAISIANAIMGKEKYKGEYPEAGTTLGTFSNRKGTNDYGVPFADLSIFQKIKMDMSRNKELKQYAAELQKQKELKAQIERDRIRNENIARSEAAARGNYTPGGSHLSRGQSGGGLGLTQSQAQSVSQANKDAGYSSFSGLAKGGFVRGSYFNGGIVSLRRR